MFETFGRQSLYERGTGYLPHDSIAWLNFDKVAFSSDKIETVTLLHNSDKL